MVTAHPLNPQAGAVPMPEDEREVDAALRAGRITHRIFPYFGWRYGERGERFTRSDSAWLAWLTRHDERSVEEEIVWLGSVLSNRGMPRWLLETHLRVLERQLTRVRAGKEPEYRRLLSAADGLRRIRLEAIDEDATRRLIDGFVARFEDGPRPLLRGAGMLVVCAVADQRSGIRNAVSSLRAWLVDVDGLRVIPGLRARLTSAEEDRFDDDAFASAWTAAIDATISAAEQGEPPAR